MLNLNLIRRTKTKKLICLGLVKNIVKLSKKIRQLYKKIYVFCFMGLGLLLSGAAFADGDNPFPSIDVTDGNVIKASGTYIELALKYGTLGVGGLLILISLGVLILRMREDSREKEHGNLLMTFVFIGLGCTIGFLLIAIGWKAFSADIKS